MKQIRQRSAQFGHWQTFPREACLSAVPSGLSVVKSLL
jgi:hypothetical protein